MVFQLMPKAMLHLTQVRPSHTPRLGPNAALDNANCNMLVPRHSLEHTTLAQSRITLREHSPSCRLWGHCDMGTCVCLAQHTSDSSLGRLLCGVPRKVLPRRQTTSPKGVSVSPTVPSMTHTDDPDQDLDTLPAIWYILRLAHRWHSTFTLCPAFIAGVPGLVRYVTSTLRASCHRHSASRGLPDESPMPSDWLGAQLHSWV